MSKQTVVQTNYTITQTGGKLDMSGQGTMTNQAELGYRGTAKAALQAARKHEYRAARKANEVS